MSNEVHFTSDLHIGHRAVARMRYVEMFGEQEAASISIEDILAWHSDLLAHNWRATVNAHDKIYVAGDLCMHGKGNVETALAWVDSLPGEKIFVGGNHDEIHPGVNRESEKWEDRYREVFSSVKPFIRRRVAGRSVLISHFPYIGGGDHTEEERFVQYRLPNMGLPLIHGHTHSAEKVSVAPVPNDDPKPYALQVHVGVDAWNYTPVHIDTVADIINDFESEGETSEQS